MRPTQELGQATSGWTLSAGPAWDPPSRAPWAARHQLWENPGRDS